MGQKTHNPQAFLDQGYPDGYSFCEKFLSSAEFTIDFLSTFKVFNASGQRNKGGYAENVAKALINRSLDSQKFLLKYVQKPRTWLSFKRGHYIVTPNLENPEVLLQSFGELRWYGPIRDDKSAKIWYIRIHRIPHRIPTNKTSDNREEEDKEEAQQTYEIRSIRWPVIAEVNQNCIALSWDGFSHAEGVNTTTPGQYTFWKKIPQVFEEIEAHIGGQWEHPQLHILLLHDLWEKFIENPQYVWSHRRVRAHSSGIALNAHSSSDQSTESEPTGLSALSRKLAETALDALEYSYPYDQEKLQQVETHILNTLIREWGTKSYEFTLKQLKNNHQSTQESEASKTSKSEIDDFSSKKESHGTTLFKVHCYFGLNQASSTQDSLQHLKCYKECGLSAGVLKFLLAELGI